MFLVVFSPVLYLLKQSRGFSLYFPVPSPPSSLKKGKKNKDDDDTSDEEREWLEALEKGNLDDNGEVRKEKDISLLTARQV